MEEPAQALLRRDGGSVKRKCIRARPQPHSPPWAVHVLTVRSSDRVNGYVFSFKIFKKQGPLHSPKECTHISHELRTSAGRGGEGGGGTT